MISIVYISELFLSSIYPAIAFLLYKLKEPGQATGWDELNRRRPRRQSRDELARDRNGRRRLRHPSAKHQRPSLDLGDERIHHRRRRTRQPQSRAELACDRAELIRSRTPDDPYLLIAADDPLKGLEASRSQASLAAAFSSS
jgi:hypothetical protein